MPDDLPIITVKSMRQLADLANRQREREMLKFSLITMEKSCPTNGHKTTAEVLLTVATKQLSDYIPISHEMRANKHQAISLINQALALLTEYNGV